MGFEETIKEALQFFDDIDNVVFEITREQETQSFLIDSLQDQLFTTGEDGNKNSLGEYSELTVQIKRRKGQPTDRITLKDTGDFYKTYSIDPFKGGFIIDANGQKSSIDLLVKYGNDILKPNEETIEIIGDYYKEKLNEYFVNLFI